jgi:methylenetetrahydrofolate dehydrogenase (NADP+)/methenyltetrahydrofolate cyclohydrolase
MIYTRRKGEKAVELGMDHETISFPVSASPESVYAIVQKLNLNSNVDGILIQRPLPKNFSEEEVLYWVAPEKDVDAFHPVNAGKLFLGLPSFLPCTPSGVMALLEYYKISPAGKLACVIGRSSIVGKPMATLLTKADATVIHCHSKTHALASLTRQADLLIVATGKMGLIDRTFVREGATVIDVGIHRTADGKIRGDVLLDDVASKVSAITPVPGGVGVMTIAILMQNTIAAAELREGK